MDVAKEAVVDSTIEKVVSDEAIVKPSTDVEALESKLAEAINSRDAAKAKLREHDVQLEEAKNTELKDKEKFKELYETLNTKYQKLETDMKDSLITNQLTTKLTESGMTSVNTALKLVEMDKLTLDDNNKVIGMDAAIETLKKDHSILFSGAKGIPPVVPSDTDVPLGYMEELTAMRASGNFQQSDFDKIQAKYGKL